LNELVRGSVEGAKCINDLSWYDNGQG